MTASSLDEQKCDVVRELGLALESQLLLHPFHRDIGTAEEEPQKPQFLLQRGVRKDLEQAIGEDREHHVRGELQRMLLGMRRRHHSDGYAWLLDGPRAAPVED